MVPIVEACVAQTHTVYSNFVDNAKNISFDTLEEMQSSTNRLIECKEKTKTLQRGL